MGIYRPFGSFNPKTEEVKDYPFEMLPKIAKRARWLLETRTSEQIENAVLTADYFVEAYFEGQKEAYINNLSKYGGWELGYLREEDRNEAGIRRLVEEWPSEADDTRPFIANADNTNIVEGLQECIGDYNLTDDVEFPNGREYEYFAALALYKVAKAIERLKSDRPYEVEDLDFLKNAFGENVFTTMKAIDLFKPNLAINYSIAGEAALIAMEAICFAEHLKKSEKLQIENTQLGVEIYRLKQPEYILEKSVDLVNKSISDRISLNATRAAIKRHTANREMKAKVFEWCDENMSRFKSMDDAAFDIAETFVPQKFRAVREWMTEWKKLRSTSTP